MQPGTWDHRAETGQPQVERTGYPLEHILPQQWKDSWPVDSLEAAVERQERLHCLGNLSLLTTSLNSKEVELASVVRVDTVIDALILGSPKLLESWWLRVPDSLLDRRWLAIRYSPTSMMPPALRMGLGLAD